MSEEEKEWLNRFSQEYICANPNHKGEILHKEKKYWSRPKEEKDGSEIYSKNNARNRCIYTKEKAQGCLDYLEDILVSDLERLNCSSFLDKSVSNTCIEDFLIALEEEPDDSVES